MTSAQHPVGFAAASAGGLSFSPEDLCACFPAYLAVDLEGCIVAAGPSLHARLGADLLGAPLAGRFEVTSGAAGAASPLPADGLPQDGAALTLRALGCGGVRLRGHAMRRGDRVWLLVGHAPDWDEPSPLGPGDFGAADAACEALAWAARSAERLQRALARAEALEEKTLAAEAASLAKSTFLATMSHEIRTPMNGVLALASLLDGTELSAEQRELVAVILGSGQALMSIINDVLDLSKVDAGGGEVEAVAFEVGELLAATEAMFRPQARSKGLALEIDCQAGIPPLEGDPTRLRQILLNLVGNAVKFTDEGRIVLRAGFAPNREARGVLSLAVSDTGIGITPAARERIFRPFAQADSSMTRRFGGTGLGLSITRRLVELMGGRIDVESRPGRGSTFRVRIPLRRAPPPLPRAPDLPLPDFTGRGLRVLVAEDNPTNQFVARRILDRLGLAAHIVPNGVEALLAWEAGGYDLILMDIEMPVLDGIEATRELRRREQTRSGARIPIVALTADALSRRGRDAVAAGMDGVATKPIDIPGLSRLILDTIGRAGPR